MTLRALAKAAIGQFMIGVSAIGAGIAAGIGKFAIGASAIGSAPPPTDREVKR